MGIHYLLPVHGLVALAVLCAALALLSGAALAAQTVDEDLVVTDTVEWTSDTYEMRANVTVASGGQLNVTDATLNFHSSDVDPIGLMVEPGGVLQIEGSTLKAASGHYFAIVSGSIVARDSSLTGLLTMSPGRIVYFDTVGGLMLEGGSAVLEGVRIFGDSEGLLTAFDSTLTAKDLRLEGSSLGLLMDGSEGTVEDLRLEGLSVGIAIEASDLHVANARAEGVGNVMWALDSTASMEGLWSNATDIHIGCWNCTLTMRDVELVGGADGLLCYGGSVDIEGLVVTGPRTGVELQLTSGRIVGSSVEGCEDIGFSLSALDNAAMKPDFEFKDNVARNCQLNGVLVVDCGDVWLDRITVDRCGYGLYLSGSRVHVVNSTVDGSVGCDDPSCDSRADGTGAWLETSILWLEGSTISRSAASGIVAYYSDVRASGSGVVDGNASGIVVINGGLALEGCQVSNNALYGVDVFGYAVPVASLDATWGNGRADVRYNVSVTVEVVDQDGALLRHAFVNASSHGTTVGPYQTGFVGTTAPMELTIFEYTYPTTNVSFDPWKFTVEYSGFTNDTELAVPAQGGKIVLHIDVPRPDLVVEGLKAPKKVERKDRTKLEATVTNQGRHPATGVRLTFYYRNTAGFTRVIAEVDLGTIAPGASRVAYANWTMEAPGDYTVVASVDVDDRIEEQEEGNNDRESPVEVTMRSDEMSRTGEAVLFIMVIILLVGIAVLFVREARNRGKDRPVAPGPDAAADEAVEKADDKAPSQPAPAEVPTEAPEAPTEPTEQAPK